MEWFNTIYFTALGQTLIHSLWQGVMIALLYFIAKQLFADQPARFKFRLASSALMAQFIFSIATFMLVLSNSVAIPMVAEQYDQLGATLTFVGTVDQWSPNWIALVGIIWLIGTIYFVFRFGIGWFQTNQIKATSTRLSNYWQSQCDTIAKKMGVQKAVTLLSAKNVSVPFTMGTLKPVILFPLGMINQLSEQEVEAILAHELAHIRYNDYAINLFFSFVEAIFYFHPVVWWLSFEMNATREESCDELAVNTIGNRIQYARTLISVQERSGFQFSTAMSMTGKKGLLHQRIFKILQQPYPIQANRNKQMGFIALGVLASFFIIGSLQAKQDEVQRDVPMEEPTKADVQATAISTDDDDIARKVIQIDNSKQEQLWPNKNKVIIKVATLPKRTVDTIPEIKKKQENYTFSYNTSIGKQTKIKMTNGNIDYLKIDGEEIPPEEYDNYIEEIKAIKNAAPPAPPAPPVPPNIHLGMFPAPIAPIAPPVPPFPPAPDFSELEGIGQFDFPNMEFDSLINQFKNSISTGNLEEDQMKAIREKMAAHQERIAEHQEMIIQRTEELNQQMDERMQAIHEEMAAHQERIAEHQEMIIQKTEERHLQLEANRAEYEEKLEQYHEVKDEEVRKQLEKMKAKKKKIKHKTKDKQKRK